MQEHHPEIGLVIVNYNSAESTGQLLADLLQQDRSNCLLTVVVADNSPDNPALGSLQQAYRNDPTLRIETMAANLGYFGAANCVLETVWKHQVPDWIIVSNADIRILQPGFFSRLADRSTGDYTVIAPRIVSTRTGLDQNPFHLRRPSALRVKLHRIIPQVRFLAWLLEAQCAIRHAIRRRLRNAHTRPETASSNVYAPHGAFIIFNRKYFERGGNLRCGAFLFAEEIFVAETCRRLGVGVTYSPSLEVLHNEHVSTKTSPIIRRFQAAAASYCFQEFFSGSENRDS